MSIGQIPNQVLTAAFEAASLSRPWESLLDVLTETLGARAAALLISDNDSNPYNVNAVSRVYANMLEKHGMEYVEHLAAYETPDWEEVAQLSAGEVLFDHQMRTPLEEIEYRPDYVYLRKYAGVGRRMGVKLSFGRSMFDAMTVAFPSTQDRIGDTSITSLRQCLPVLAKAVETGRTFGKLQNKYQAALGALNHLKLGVVVTDEQGRGILSNSQATRLIEEDDAFQATQGELTPYAPESAAALTKAVSNSVSSANGTNKGTTFEMSVAKRSGQSPVLVTVSPFSDAEGELGDTFRGSIVTMIDGETFLESSAIRLADVYKLTRAETGVLLHLCTGITYQEVSKNLEKSVHTVRNQAQSILDKTGCRSKAGLLRLISQEFPPIT